MDQRFAPAGSHPAPVGLPGAPPPRPRRTFLIVALVLLVLAVLGGAVAATAVLISTVDTRATAGGTQDTGVSAGSAASAGKRSRTGAENGATMTISIPDAVDLGDRIPLQARGETGPVSAAEGGMTVSVWIAGQDDPGERCPSTIGSYDEGWTSLAFANLYGTGPYRAAGNEQTPGTVGTYTVCGYAETFTAAEQARPALVTSTTIEVRGVARLAEVDPAAGAPEPGTYVASGADVFGAPAGTTVEFEVEAQGEKRVVTYVAAINLPTTRCDRERRPVREDVFSDDVEEGSLLDLGEAKLGSSLSLTGGTPGDGTYHGQLAVRTEYEHQCYGQIAFVARRALGSAQPLRERLG